MLIRQLNWINRSPDAIAGTGGQVITDTESPKVLPAVDTTNSSDADDAELDAGKSVDTDAPAGEKVDKDASRIISPEELAKKFPSVPNLSDLTEDEDSNEKILKQDKLDKKAKEGAEDEQKSDDEPFEVKLGITEDKTSVDNKAKELESNKRDYTLFDEDTAAFLKQQPNNVFNALKAVYPKIKTAIEKQVNPNKLPDNYAEHPDAFILSPEYNESVSKYNQASFEERHWTEQLEKIEMGEEWTPFLGINKKTGEPVYGEPQPSNIKAKIAIQSALNQAGQYKNSFAGKIQSLQTNHKQQHQQIIDKIKTESSQYFPWINDEKLLDIQIPSENPNAKSVSIKEHLSGFSNKVHPSLRNSPMTEVAANLYVTSLIAHAKLTEALKELGKYQQIKSDRKSTEASSSTAKGGGSGLKSTKIITKPLKPGQLSEVPNIDDLLE